jgi:RimJ/RimL family protein N-acetyltransferase
MQPSDMVERHNSFGQPIGDPMPDWSRRAHPPETLMTGRYCRIERLDAERHGAELFTAFAAAPDARDWTYLSVGPFADAGHYADYLRGEAAKTDPLHHAIIDAATGKAVGTAALMRIDPAHGVIEIGSIAYSSLLKRSRAGTEAMFLFMRRVFDELGYRRYEWKCDSLNGPSRRAAERYGFQYEGTFRQAIVYKGRSRDTAWFSIIDRDWPAIRTAFERWLAPENFDAVGIQRQSLASLRHETRVAT